MNELMHLFSMAKANDINLTEGVVEFEVPRNIENNKDSELINYLVRLNRFINRLEQDLSASTRVYLTRSNLEIVISPRERDITNEDLEQHINLAKELDVNLSLEGPSKQDIRKMTLSDLIYSSLGLDNVYHLLQGPTKGY